MSGNDFQISCPKCGSVNSVRGKAMTLALTCNACEVYFRVGNWNKNTLEFQYQAPLALPIGSKGRVDNFVYEVLGFVVKEESKYHYKWREYLVFNPYRGYAFLSEYDGHWNFVWPIEENPRANDSNSSFLYESSEYKLYQHYSASVIYAKGEFFFDVVDMTENTVNSEFISPPFMLAVEKSDDSILWCKGEYFTRQQIAEMFAVPVKKLPPRNGIGYTQPFNTSFSDGSLIALSVLLLLVTLTIQLLFNTSAKDKVVFHGEYGREELKDQKMIATPGFDLTDGTRSLEVFLYAPVVNDWFFGEFSLVNETDGTEYNFTKEIEYYKGYDGGESWTEGSTHAEAFLSQIPSGRYHLNIYPEFGPGSHAFSITVSRDVPMHSNFYFVALALAIFPVFFFIRKNHREQKRWSDSEFSPYSTD